MARSVEQLPPPAGRGATVYRIAAMLYARPHGVLPAVLLLTAALEACPKGTPAAPPTTARVTAQPETIGAAASASEGDAAEPQSPHEDPRPQLRWTAKGGLDGTDGTCAGTAAVSSGAAFEGFRACWTLVNDRGDCPMPSM